MIEELRNIPSKVNLEQFDVAAFSKEKIRELFRTGKLPTAEAMVDEILLRAMKMGVNDIHIEPMQTHLQIRYGYEGVLSRIVSFPKEIADNLANVLKTKAALNAFEKKKPQEGRFSTVVGAHQFDFRVNIIPVMTGERIAIRVLHKTAQIIGVSEVGFSQANLEKIRRLLRHPMGLLLVVGPSGSGKTTTVYAAINELNTPDRNIITVEDPIEYKLDFATQVQASSTDKTFSFAEALRSILRQDPNVIMVGEIRDADTGIVAAEAALTGNLVLSTMLSGDALGIIPRLTNLGLPPYWLGSTLVGVIYQQLIRATCTACKEQYDPPPGELAMVRGLNTGQATFYRGKGCPQCNGSGYVGRLAVHEVLEINETIRDLIYQQAPVLKMKEAAVAAGFENIRTDAFGKVAAGMTTVAEFVRSMG